MHIAVKRAWAPAWGASSMPHYQFQKSISNCKLRNVESSSHNSKCDCKMLKVAVILRNVTANVENCSHVTAAF